MALDQLSATDRDIVAVLSEHRVATTQQISTLLQLPERTARYRLDRLWKLGMCGGRQPYADQGSAPYHWWPSRLADAFHRGRELPPGGEREDPQEQFLRHAAAITGLYVALVRLAPTLGWELTAREFALAETFFRHPGQVLSREQILSHTVPLIRAYSNPRVQVEIARLHRLIRVV